MLKDASFKLQLNSTTEGWIDYTPNDGKALVHQTNDKGQVKFSNLGYGDYRLVETKAAPGYDLSKTEGYDENDQVAYVAYFKINNGDETGHVLKI